MTIPRIGNKIVRVKSSLAPDSIEQDSTSNSNNSPINDENEQGDLHDFEDASLDEVFEDEETSEEHELTTSDEMFVADDDYSDELFDEHAQDDVESEQEHEIMVNSRHPEDNYSIEQFTQEFTEALHNDSMPLLAQYDSERKQGLILTCLITGFIVFSAIALTIFSDFDKRFYLSLLLLIISVISCFFIKNKLENKLKKGVIPLLVKSIPNFNWVSESPIPEDDITDCKIFSKSKEAAKNFYNAFNGQYRGVDISIVESKFLVEKQELFSGAIIRLQMNKDFLGTTVIRPKKDVLVKSVKDLKKLKYQKYELADPEFNKLYNVYTSDQEEARMLVTPEFIESFYYIYTAFGAKVAYCSFFGKYIYIAPYCRDGFMGKRDLFNICSLFKSVANDAQYVTLYNELTSIMALVDSLKLVKKMGL